MLEILNVFVKISRFRKFEIKKPDSMNYTEHQKKRHMNTRYQHGRLHTGCFENHSSHIPSPIPSHFQAVMIQNDVRLHVSRKRYM